MTDKPYILITGADGFVGRKLCQTLGNDYETYRLITPGSTPDDINALAVDLTDSEETRRLAEKLEGIHFHAVIHLAFILCAPGDWNNFHYLHSNNRITENVIELLRSIKCDNLLNFSSLAVYPNRNGFYTEDSTVDPSPNTECLYGLAKFNSEVAFDRFQGNEINVVNFRMCQVYGPGMQNDRLVGLFRKEIQENDTITVFGNGERVSNFIHIDDVAEAVRAVLSTPLPGTYNLGCSSNISYLELAEKVKEAKGTESTQIILSEKGLKTKVEIDTSKFQKTFGYTCSKMDFDW